MTISLRGLLALRRLSGDSNEFIWEKEHRQILQGRMAEDPQASLQHQQILRESLTHQRHLPAICIRVKPSKICLTWSSLYIALYILVIYHASSTRCSVQLCEHDSGYSNSLIDIQIKGHSFEIDEIFVYLIEFSSLCKHIQASSTV